MRWMVAAAGGQVPILADDEDGRTVVILAHGAGSHMEQKTIGWLSGLVRKAGARVVRFNFLYRAQGRSMPDRMPVLIETYRAVIGSVRERLAPESLIIGGHSMGGRVASMVEAQGQTADGLLLFGYPLHPPGQPEKLRDAHLGAIKTPTLQLNGTQDALCTKEIMDRIVSTLDPGMWQLCWIAGADHSYAVKKSSGRRREDVESDISAALQGWPPLR
ncbi:MAG: alpha/beta fold hydrolase [Fimbriimonas ginsengisoli]|uniref:Alpha/beta fold hydrolase n=1 Tax=Fimbriimonas ginsengisoli TaxID=1005039 RepID=A0A931LSH3_FIMGI|nr:alpha/beta fold hydrolase [Fimbriimonas ginsengisoli]